MFGMGSIRDMTASVKLVDNVTRPLVKINRSMDMAKMKAGGFTRAIQKNRTSLMALGAVLTGVSAGITLALKGSTRSFGEFEAAMANVSTMVDTTTESMAGMSQEVLSLSKILPVTAIDLAGALYQVRSAGVDAGGAMSFLEVSARAGVAGVATTETAVDALTAVIKGYGMEFSEAEMVSNKLFKTVKLGKTNFEELATSVGGTVPLANAMNVSLNELMAGYATLTGVTGKTSEVTTQLESIMSGFIKPTDTMTKTIKGLGYATSAEMIAEQGLIGTLEKLRETTDGSMESLGELFARKEALTAITALLGDQYDDFIMKQKEMEDSAGAMDAAYRKNAATFKASMQKMSNSIFALKVAMGSALAPTIMTVAKGISGLVNWFTGLPEPVMKTTAVLAALTAVVFGVGGGILLLAGAISFALPGLTLLAPIITGIAGAVGTLGLALLTNPITWAILGLVGAVLLLQHAWTKNWGGIQEKTRAVIDFIKPKLEWLLGILNTLSYLIPGIGAVRIAADMATGKLPSPRELATSTVSTVSNKISTVSKSIGNVEIKVDGSGDPNAVAKAVKKEIEREFTEM